MNDNANHQSENKTEFQVKSPAITLPKGGGSIKGMGEKFSANPVTGTGNLSIPIPTSPGRSGFEPKLSLSYDSGSGNGIFGFGWNLSIPSITRKTDKGIPRYNDAEESDVFILSGAEDLVPVFRQTADGEYERDGNGKLIKFEIETDEFLIHRYRPRIEGLFARIERWTNKKSGGIHWRSISRDNIITLYGLNNNSCIFDPVDTSTHIFSWLICQSYDDKGNAIIYHYAEENDEKIDLSLANEHNRTRTANRYLQRVKYGNRTPNRKSDTWEAIDPTTLADDDWMFELVFDFNEGYCSTETTDAEGYIHITAKNKPDPNFHWPCRPDPFSSFRSGFEVRTYRRCHRVLMFHHFPKIPENQGGYDGLVRSIDFDYADLDFDENPTIQDELNHQGSTRFASFITSVTQCGYSRESTDPANEYLKKSLPPLEFKYSKADIVDEIITLDQTSFENLPIGVDGSQYQWVDLDGEGLSGILTEQADAWFYKANLGEGKFGPSRALPSRPSHIQMTAGGGQFLDLAGDGQLDLVSFSGTSPGFYERTFNQEWEQFKTFVSLPNIRWDDPNLRFIDLNGDGHADILISEEEAFTWYPSLAEDGFDRSKRVHQMLDEEYGPRLVFSDGTSSIYLADFSGDGLVDIARIRNGEVCYWPNLGYGRFGAKITMDHAPLFDHPDQFNQNRIRLVDIDGSGTNDIIYLGRDSVHLYFNQSGNGWSNLRLLEQFPHVDNIASVMTTDLLGNGTGCLVWSSPLPANQNQPLRYIALMDEKPHLLTHVINNLGAETEIHYVPSTYFYLKDREEGQPWISRIPFPVHVVERVITYDWISRNQFTTRYAYHHGAFDGIEREFRGFGMVEQWDTEKYTALSDNSDEYTNISNGSNVPPIHTKTWFHTGIYFNHEFISNYFCGEYFHEPGSDIDNLLLPDTILPSDLSLEECREACRSLKGSMLRQEVYADDIDLLTTTPEQIKRAETPYTVTEQNFSIRMLQPQEENRHAVFLTHANEAINFHYERNPVDPRIQHSITLEVDDLGNIKKQVAIGYGRRTKIYEIDDDGLVHIVDNPELLKLSPEDQSKQKQTLITYTESDLTNGINIYNVETNQNTHNYRTPLPCEVKTYELTGYQHPDTNWRYEAADFVRQDVNEIQLKSDQTVAYEEQPLGSNCRRMIERVRTLYRPNDLGFSPDNNPMKLLSFAKLESLALPGETYKLAFTPGLLQNVYKRNGTDLLPDAADIMEGPGEDEGGYVDLNQDGCWWIPSGRTFYSENPTDNAAAELIQAREHFFFPRRYRDPFENSSFVTYDKNDLLICETKDALNNCVTVEKNDYRVLQPCLISDPNRNQSQVSFDTLGLVAGTAVMGKPSSNPKEGDNLSGFVPDLSQQSLNEFITKPRQPHASEEMMSEVTDIVHTLLGNASTRIVYDVYRFKHSKENNPADPRKWLPAYAATIARETHFSDLKDGERSRLQVSFSYSDGFGREIQKKIQAEVGPIPERDAEGNFIIGEDGQPQMSDNTANPRWVGSGWTIFNNKGKPVRQYEPFFTGTHDFEFNAKIGVSPILFYDPAERVVATLHPNHTWEKVIFDPWQQETWDVNDTLLIDPKTDPDIFNFLVNPDGNDRVPSDEYLPTWYALRTSTNQIVADEFARQFPDATIRKYESIAAEKSENHAQTPTVTHFDTLGRPFMTTIHNKLKCEGHNLNGYDEKYHTWIELDIEGNQRKVYDEYKLDNGDWQKRLVMSYDYSMAGPDQDENGNPTNTNLIHQSSMEAGERWIMNDIAGNPIRRWDSRGFIRKMTYDELRRPRKLFVDENGNLRLAEETIYGESRGEADNLRTRVYQVKDGAGIVSNISYDFKGNLLTNQRELLQTITDTNGNKLPAYKAAVNWSISLQGEYEIYSGNTIYDALNRPIEITTPHSSGMKANKIRSEYNEANLLEKIDVDLREEGNWTPFITNINYNEKGQRKDTSYGNQSITRYSYDPLTFHLTNLTTTRENSSNGVVASIFANERVLQNLDYTYDPTGNITSIIDHALKNVFSDSQSINTRCNYEYDAAYRLIKADGREHIGQTEFDFNLSKENNRDYQFSGHLSASNLLVLHNYDEYYEYDEAGNFKTIKHCAKDRCWTRTYTYNEISLLETGIKNNRLSKTIIGANLNALENYTYLDSKNQDVHGCMTSIKNMGMIWDFEDQLQQVNLEGGGTAYYVFDTAGQRVRKVIEQQSGSKQKERIYLGSMEIYWEFNGANPAPKLERESLHIMDDKQRIALVETRTDSTPPEQTIRYQLGNHLGSASVELDKDGNFLTYEEYHPYGTTAYQAGKNAAEVSFKRYRYTGKERDEESGLYYYGARFYALWLGRWISCDSEGIRDDINLYEHVRSNPVVHFDNDGNKTRRVDLEKNKTAVYALIVVNIPEKRVYAYAHKKGKLIMMDEYEVKPGHGEKRLGNDEGNWKSVVGLFKVWKIYENYSTQKYPIDASEDPFRAAFGEYAIKMSPNAKNQWLHGTTKILGELLVYLDIGSGSHGCLRMTNSSITKIANNINSNTLILRIYATKVKREGNTASYSNIYKYNISNNITFYPEDGKISGAIIGEIGPKDARKGGYKYYQRKLRKLGFLFEKNNKKLESSKSVPSLNQ